MEPLARGWGRGLSAVDCVGLSQLQIRRREREGRRGERKQGRWVDHSRSQGGKGDEEKQGRRLREKKKLGG